MERFKNEPSCLDLRQWVLVNLCRLIWVGVKGEQGVEQLELSFISTLLRYVWVAGVSYLKPADCSAR